MCKATKYINDLKLVVDGMNNDMKMISEMISNVDSELNETYHAIEIGKYSASAGYKKIKELQEVLRKRRMIKHEYSRLLSVMQTLNASKLSSEIIKAKSNLNKLSDKNAKYTDGWNMKFEDLVTQ